MPPFTKSKQASLSFCSSIRPSCQFRNCKNYKCYIEHQIFVNYLFLSDSWTKEKDIQWCKLDNLTPFDVKRKTPKQRLLRLARCTFCLLFIEPTSGVFSISKSNHSNDTGLEVINVDGDQKNGICAPLPLYRRQNQCEDSPVIKIGTQCDTMGWYWVTLFALFKGWHWWGRQGT